MVFMFDQTVRAKGISSTVETEQVAFVFVGIGVDRTGDEVAAS